MTHLAWAVNCVIFAVAGYTYGYAIAEALPAIDQQAIDQVVWSVMMENTQ